MKDRWTDQLNKVDLRQGDAIELLDEHFATATRRVSEALGEARQSDEQATLL